MPVSDLDADGNRNIAMWERSSAHQHAGGLIRGKTVSGILCTRGLLVTSACGCARVIRVRACGGVRGHVHEARSAKPYRSISAGMAPSPDPSPTMPPSQIHSELSTAVLLTRLHRLAQHSARHAPAHCTHRLHLHLHPHPLQSRLYCLSPWLGLFPADSCAEALSRRSRVLNARCAGVPSPTFSGLPR